MEKAHNTVYSFGSATHAAKRAADIVFILQNKNKLEYATLVAALNETLKVYGEDQQLDSVDLGELRAVSRKLYAVFASKDVDEAARQLNAILGEYAHAPRLSVHGNSPWHMHVDSDDDAPWAEWFAASSSLALATLLAEKRRNPGGLCASPSCGRPFIDLGKGGGRSYCSPRCATRERVAAYRKKN